MSSRFRTIDDLGIDQSIRYAEDQQLLKDQKLFKEDRLYTQTQIDVSVPSYWDEYEMVFQTKKRNLSWAEFLTPPSYNEQKRRLFTYIILPFLGSTESYEVLKRKIKEKIDKDQKKYQTNKKKRFEEGLEYDWEEELSLDHEEKESKTLLSLMDLIGFLDTILTEINSRRNQYQKG